MEQLVLGIFQEQLSKVIIGFRKEQVNANLLNGKGEIRDVSLNCSVLNEAIARVCPYIRFEEIHVSRIGFHVTSWANLRRAPIIVDIGHITAKIQEPLTLLPKNQRRRIEMITESELRKKLSEGFKPLRGSGSYGLVDRIVDNLTIEIEMFRMEYQTWGKFKTRRPGPWTPPLLRVELENLKVCMVDAEGIEGSPDQVWAHNRGRRDSFLTYKKVQGKCHIQVISHEQSCDQKGKASAHCKLANLNMEVQIAVERRLRDGGVLACQLDMTMPEMDIQIDSKDIHSLAHFVSGVEFCLAKDRSFKDPLKSLEERVIPNPSSSSPAVVDVASAQKDPIGTLNDAKDDDDDKSFVGNTDAEQKNFDESPIRDDLVTSWHGKDGIAENEEESFTGNSTSKRPSRSRSKSERSVILLPNDLIIYKSISFTCSIHELVVWGSYPVDEKNGCLELVAKGCIAEIIWPKNDKEHGFYFQLSTSFISLEERIGHHKRTLLLAGMQRDDHLSLHLPSRKPQEIHADEFFPLFEQRNIRDDPIDLRHSFPTQAFGLKTTIDFLNQSNKDETCNNFMVLHEVGGDEIEIVLDTDVFLRLSSFIMSMDGERFDPRWKTGDWAEFLTSDMLNNPSETFDLDECIQDFQQIFLDENSMISSDLFNVTARLSNVVMRIPPAFQDSLRSCEIAVQWKETTLVVSSRLPRTFVAGKIANSVSGGMQGDNEKAIIDFPNDPTDICYTREQQLVEKATSTFRLQLTTRGFEINAIPVISFCSATEPQKVIAISDSTIILCFEGETPTDSCNRMKITVFLSILIQELVLNVDFEILAGSTCTLLRHKEQIVAITEIMHGIYAQTTDSPESLNDTKIAQSLKGRRILASRHMSRSRETGGLAIIFSIQQKDFRLQIWRQNVPLSGPLREKLGSSSSSKWQDDEGIIRLLKVLDFETNDLEVGIEFDFHSSFGHRTVIKAYLEHANLRVVDLAREIEDYKNIQEGPSSVKPPPPELNMQWNLINLCTFGHETLPCGLNLSGLAQQFAFRLEAHTKNSVESWSMVADVSAPSTINIDSVAMKNTIILIIEALLLPSWSNYATAASEELLFPPGTIGALFYSVGTELLGTQNFALFNFNSFEIDAKSSDPILERVLRSTCQMFLPLKLQVILLRCELANLLICVPSESYDKDNHKKIFFLVNQSDIIARLYPVPGSSPSEIEQVLACQGKNWSTLINTKKEGFYQYIYSKQSLLSMVEGSDGTELEMVVHPFEISLTYSGSEMGLSMEKGILIKDVRRIENVLSRLKSAFKLFSECFSQIHSIVRAMMYRDSTKVVFENTPDDKSEEKSKRRDRYTLSRARKLLRKVNEEILFYQNNVRDGILKKDNELEAMKIALFFKERERFGAISLMTSRVAGWIRMGGQHRSGQRVLRKSLFWPFWAILRKDLLILYPRPGESKPSDIVSLANARMRRLAGGNSKQDTKRGFSIVESNGMTRYFVTGNAQEFELWRNEIYRTIRLFSDSKESGFKDSLDLNTSESTVNSIYIGRDDAAEASQKNNGIGNRLSSAFQSARLKGKEISDRRQSALTKDQSIQNDNSSMLPVKCNSEINDDSSSGALSQDGQPTSKGSEIGKKFSEVRLVTKSRFGSAIQSARIKRDEIANRLKTQDDLPSKSGIRLDVQGGLADSSVDLIPRDRIEDKDIDGNRGAFGPIAAIQLSNKLGSAIQNARIKAMGNSEKLDCLNGDDRHPDRQQNESKKNCDPTQSSSSLGSFTNTLKPPQALIDTLQPSIQSKEVPKQEEKNTRNSRFNFLKRNEDSQDDSLFGGDLITLKNIYEGQEINSLLNPSRGDVSQLKLLKEKWIVKVSVITDLSKHSVENKIKDHEIESSEVVDNMDDKSRVMEDVVDPIQTNENIDEDQNLMGHFDLVDGDQRDFSKSYSQQAISILGSNNRINDFGTQGDVPDFLVKVVRVQPTQTEASFEKQWRLGDVLQLYSGVSELLEDFIPQLFGTLPRAWDEDSAPSTRKLSENTSIEKVMLCGRVLGGLLEARESFGCMEGFRRYLCEAIENFLNVLLECPLPIDGLTLLSSALGINEQMEDLQHKKCDSYGGVEKCSSTTSLVEDFAETNEGQEGVIDEQVQSSHRPVVLSKHVFNILAACEAELNGAEARNTNINSRSQHTERSMNTNVSPSTHTQPIFYEPLLPPMLVDHIHDSIQESMMNALAERDEAHAQLIGANVMHTNSLERIRKKNERLEIDAMLSHEIAQLQLQQDLQATNIVNIFGKPDERVEKIRKEIDRKIEKVHHVLRNDDGDAEMMELCSQLATEISAKTSLALEIERLKEIREMERKTHRSEKEALKEEVRRLQGLLYAENQKL